MDADVCVVSAAVAAPYPDAVLARFRDPALSGRFEDRVGVVRVQAGTPAAPFRLVLEVKWQAGQVQDARFQAFGCPFTIAVGAWLAGWSLGRNRDRLAEFSPQALVQALEIPDSRAHCVLMAQDLLRELLTRLQ